MLYFFFVIDPAPPETYTYCHPLPLHAARPISRRWLARGRRRAARRRRDRRLSGRLRADAPRLGDYGARRGARALLLQRRPDRPQFPAPERAARGFPARPAAHRQSRGTARDGGAVGGDRRTAAALCAREPAH